MTFFLKGKYVFISGEGVGNFKKFFCPMTMYRKQHKCYKAFGKIMTCYRNTFRIHHPAYLDRSQFYQRIRIQIKGEQSSDCNGLLRQSGRLWLPSNY